MIDQIIYGIIGGSGVAVGAASIYAILLNSHEPSEPTSELPPEHPQGPSILA